MRQTTNAQKMAVGGRAFAAAALAAMLACSTGAFAQQARSWPSRIDGGEILARDARTVSVCGADGKATSMRLDDLSGADRAVAMNWQAGGVRMFVVRGHGVRGRIVGRGAGKVVLRMEDGREATVAVSEMAPPDRTFLARWSAEEHIPGFGQPTRWWSTPLLRCTVEAGGSRASLRAVGGAGLVGARVIAENKLLAGKGLRAVPGRPEAFSIPPGGGATLADAIAREQYVAFRAVVPPGHVLDLNRVSIGFQRSSVDAPDAAALFTGVAGFRRAHARTVPSFRKIDKYGSVTTGDRTFTLEGRGLGLTNLTKAVEVRLYLYGPAKETETVRIVSAGLDGQLWKTSAKPLSLDGPAIGGERSAVNIVTKLIGGRAEVTLLWDRKDRLRTGLPWANVKHLGPVAAGQLVGTTLKDLEPNTRHCFRFYARNPETGRFAWSPPGTFRRDVHQQYRVSEFTFFPDRQHAQPWKTVELTAIFDGPKGLTRTVGGFWDGETWKVRFTPPKPGSWKYVTRCMQDQGLGGRSGTFMVRPAAGATPLHRHGGGLRVTENGHFLSHADGTPMFFVGESCSNFDVVPRLSPDGKILASDPELDSDQKYFLDRRESQGFNAQQRLLARGFRDGKLDLAFYRAADRQIAYANDSGIVWLLTAGAKSTGGRTLDQWKTIWRYLIARYGARDVVWSLFWEYDATRDRDEQLANNDVAFTLGGFVKNHDPYGRLVSLFPWAHAVRGANRGAEWDQTWLDFISIQHGHGAWPSPSPYVKAFARTPAKPVIDLEANYEGIYRGHKPPPVPGWKQREIQWQMVQSGNAGVGYGAHGVWNHVKHYADARGASWGPNAILWWQAVEFEAAWDMRHLRATYESLNFSQLKPFPHVSNPRAAIITSDGSTTFVVYFYRTEDERKAVALTDVPAGRFRMEWRNPRTGAVTPLAEVAAPTDGRAVLPRPPDGHDWVLVLRRKLVPGQTGDARKITSKRNPNFLLSGSGRGIIRVTILNRRESQS
jgi:hypothetical protein